jgi:hypothetical protein
MRIYLKLIFEEKQEYVFNGFVNNSKVENLNSTISELSEISNILSTPGYETVNMRKKLKDGLKYPFNEFYFKIGFKNNSSGSNWNISTGVHDVQISDNFKLELNESKIYFSGELILKCSVKDDCFNDLLLNINNVFIDECSIKKINSESYNDYKSFRFTYTGDWNEDQEITKDIIENSNKSSRKIIIEHSKSLRKSWL